MRALSFALLVLVGCGSEDVAVAGTYKGLFSTLITCPSGRGGPRAYHAVWYVSKAATGDGISILTEGTCGTLAANRDDGGFEITPKICDPVVEGTESFVHTIDRGNVTNNGQTLSLLMHGLTKRTDPAGTENCASTHSATLERIADP